MAINLITGKPGSGKTAYLAKLVKEKFLPNGVQVYSYFRLKFNDSRIKYFKEISEIQSYRNAVVILDEAQIWFNARKWNLLPASLQYALQQHRHKGIDIWGAVQNLQRLDIIVRELVAKYYEVKKIMGSRDEIGRERTQNPWGIFRICEFHPEEAGKIKRQILGLKFFRINKELCDFYNTFAEYENEEENLIYVPVKICPLCKHKKILWKNWVKFEAIGVSGKAKQNISEEEVPKLQGCNKTAKGGKKKVGKTADNSQSPTLHSFLPFK